MGKRSNFQIFGSNFEAYFQGSNLKPLKEKRQESVTKTGPKIGSQNLIKSSNIFQMRCLLQESKGCQPRPTKIRKTYTLAPSKPKIYRFFEMVEDCWSKLAVPIQLKNCQQRENQMNIPNFCSRIGHSNLKPKLSASLLYGVLQKSIDRSFISVFAGPVSKPVSRQNERSQCSTSAPQVFFPHLENCSKISFASTVASRNSAK